MTSEAANDDASVWDYSGLVAECFDLWFGEEPFSDQEFYSARIREGQGRALEIGCGTGRLLLPYLRAGLPVEGLDASEEMLAICRRKAEALGLVPVLHRQTMQRVNLPDRFATLFIPQCSFQILTQPGEGLATLRGLTRCLEPGGRIYISLELPASAAEASGQWNLLREGRLESREATVAIYDRSRYDWAQSMLYREVRYEVDGGSGPVVALEQELREKYYSVADFRELLAQAGLVGLRAWGDYTEDELSKDHGVAVFEATKPRGAGD